MKRWQIYILFFLFLSAACSGPVTDPDYNFPARPLPGKDAMKLLKGASRHIGEPYKYGGISSRGWDCSGFVYGMFKKYLRISVPRSTDELISASIGIKPGDSRPGDLVFFKIDSKESDHVGIYIGKNRFIHASNSSGVTVSDLDDRYYGQNFAGFRRIRFGLLAAGR